MRTLILALLCSLNLGIHAETLKIATGEYPPWTTESEPHHGYINQIVEQAFKLEGIEVEFHFMPWKRALEATRIGQYHASSYWGESVERQEEFYLSDVLNTEPFVFFYRKSLSSLSWQSLSDLAPYAIGATRGYTYTEAFWTMANEDKLRISVVDDDMDNLQRLVDGQIDLFPISRATGQYLLEKHFTPEQSDSIDVHPQPINTNRDYILFSRNIPGNEQNVQAFNRGLAKLQQSDKIRQLRKAILK